MCPGVTKTCDTEVDEYTTFYELTMDECLAFQGLFNFGDPCPSICGSEIKPLEKYVCYTKDDEGNLSDVEKTVGKRDSEVVCDECDPIDWYSIEGATSCPRA